MAKKTKKLTVACDPGTSLTKVLYQVGSGQLKYLAMAPQVLKLPPGTFSGLPLGIGSGKPEDNAWVRVGGEAESAGETECCVVGRLAAEYRARARIRPLKRRSLVPKLLGAIAPIALSEKLASGFELELALLLPLGELEKEGLRSEIESAFAAFWFGEHHYQANLKRYQVLPEGMGIVYSRLRRGTLE